ncbi:hypothetical protein ID866_7382 [Astraeus odoratus]|nr:hypothetical protein ID866_7382 [Astraeus odoratus]
MSSTDPRPVLERLRVAERSSRYNILLNGRVHADGRIVLKCGSAVVRSGILGLQAIQVAIKTPPGGLRDDDTTIKKFLKEAHTWSKLCHRNVLPLLGITTEVDFTVSMVSRWQGRGNARDHVQDTAIDPRLLIQGIANGLEYLHNHKYGKVVHGDLKGVNVLISDQGEALLTDFGLSFLTNSSFTISISPQRGGTLHWCAPETFDDDFNPSAKADIWAFGMTALELFTRRDPFHNDRSTNAIIRKILMGTLPGRPDNGRTLSRMTDQWWNMIRECWKSDPKDRPTTSVLVQRIQHIVCFLVHIAVLSLTELSRYKYKVVLQITR